MTSQIQQAVKKAPEVVRHTRAKKSTVQKNSQLSLVPKQAPPVVPKATPLPVVAILPRAAISRGKDPYWKEQGWQYSLLQSLFKIKQVYTGSYKTPYASFRGEIVGDDYFIFDPSAEILHGPHGACFTPVSSDNTCNKYKIHFNPYPSDINSGIASVERAIIEIYKTF